MEMKEVSEMTDEELWDALGESLGPDENPMYGIDFSGPPEFNKELYNKQRAYYEARSKKDACMRKCHNPDCNWQEMIDSDMRVCPACGWEIIGWENKKTKEELC